MAICSRAQYRNLTNDLASFDGDVDEALANAQATLEFETDRLFEQATRTEVLRVDVDGYVYPKALPIVSVSVPANTTIDGDRVLAGVSSLTVLLTANSDISLTYVGGYTAANMPKSLIKLVARMAYAELFFESPFPKGATRVKVGDVEYAGENLGADPDSRLARDIRRWRREPMEMY